MVKVLDKTGFGQQILFIAIFVIGYIAGELDGWAFLLVLVAVAAAFFYRRAQKRKAEQLDAPTPTI